MPGRTLLHEHLALETNNPEFDPSLTDTNTEERNKEIKIKEYLTTLSKEQFAEQMAAKEVADQ